MNKPSSLKLPDDVFEGKIAHSAELDKTAPLRIYSESALFAYEIFSVKLASSDLSDKMWLS